MENGDFTGRIAIVTGAWRGLGRAAAVRLHERGASVAVNVRDRERAEALAKEIGERAFAVPGDVAAEGVPDDIAHRYARTLRTDRHSCEQRGASSVDPVSRSQCGGMAQSDRGQPHRAILDDESRFSRNARPALWPHH